MKMMQNIMLSILGCTAWAALIVPAASRPDAPAQIVSSPNVRAMFNVQGTNGPSCGVETFIPIPFENVVAITEVMLSGGGSGYGSFSKARLEKNGLVVWNAQASSGQVQFNFQHLLLRPGDTLTLIMEMSFCNTIIDYRVSGWELP